MPSNIYILSLQRKGKEPTEHVPEVILNNFTTRLGHSIGRMFASLFPHDPQFIGRQVATFHNQRDYIFFRFHRWFLAPKLMNERYCSHNLTTNRFFFLLKVYIQEWKESGNSRTWTTFYIKVEVSSEGNLWFQIWRIWMDS